MPIRGRADGSGPGPIKNRKQLRIFQKLYKAWREAKLLAEQIHQLKLLVKQQKAVLKEKFGTY